MTKTTTYLLLMLLTILAGIYFYISCCSSCGNSVKEEASIKEEVIAPPTPEPTSYPFAISNAAYKCDVNDNYNFNRSSSKILKPIESSVIGCIGSLKTFLTNNNEDIINITGHYTSEETNHSAFPNLGLARANAVKNHFAENGISPKRINIFGTLKDEMIPKEYVYLGPISYSLDVETSEDSDELKALYDRIKSDPLVLHFDTAETTINLSASQRQKVAEISRYIDKTEGAQVNIVGHTDNTGDAANNIIIGQGRADFAKNYFMRNGLSADKIKATSKGQTQPIESNATEAGKAKNRRTVVTLR